MLDINDIEWHWHSFGPNKIALQIKDNKDFGKCTFFKTYADYKVMVNEYDQLSKGNPDLYIAIETHTSLRREDLEASKKSLPSLKAFEEEVANYIGKNKKAA